MPSKNPVHRLERERPTQPTTPAAAAAHPRAPKDGADDGLLSVPPAPGLGMTLWAVCCGAMVTVGVTVVTVCVAMWVTLVLPSPADAAQYGTFGVVAFVIVVVAAAAWWRALRGGARDHSRWVGLSFPFFAVVGVAAGLAFVAAARPAEAELFAHRSRGACQRLTGVESGPTVNACLPSADDCQREVIAAGGVLADVDACLRR